MDFHAKQKERKQKKRDEKHYKDKMSSLKNTQVGVGPKAETARQMGKRNLYILLGIVGFSIISAFISLFINS